LKAFVTEANNYDVTQLPPLIDQAPSVVGKPGHPRQHADSLYVHRAYDSESHREELRQQRFRPHLAKRNTEHGSGLDEHLRVVERTVNWLHQFRRVRVCFERRSDIHETFLILAESLICFRTLRNGSCQEFSDRIPPSSSIMRAVFSL
jgi:transposase